MAGLRPWLRAPLTLQVVSLLVVALVAAQVAAALTVIALPPPQPQVYHLGELAVAFRHPGYQPRHVRPLVSHVIDAPPAAGFPDAAAERSLATLLDVPEKRVQVRVERHTPLGRAWHAASIGLAGQPDRMDGGPPPMLPPDLGGPHPGERFGPPPHHFGDPGRPLFEHFTAAVQQPDGRWRVLSPTPASFPTAWQRRAMAWLASSLILLTIMGVLFGRRITAPLREFARAADRFGNDPNAPQMQLNGPAEIGVAAAAFNQMQARLKRFIADRTAMVGAISHDLRTPLARIRFKLEKAPPDLRVSIAADVAQMEKMIDSVLDFIRDVHANRPRERLDLASVVECVVDDAASVGGQAELTVKDSPTVVADPVALQRLFANLVDNAVKYGGEADVAVGAEPGRAVVEITDRGPGLPPAELERVFEPFYRADAARNLDVGGIGLGLAVARALAREHGGDVTLAAGSPGLVARVWLPTA